MRGKRRPSHAEMDVKKKEKTNRIEGTVKVKILGEHASVAELLDTITKAVDQFNATAGG